MLYGGRSAIGAVISSEVDVGRWAAEVARGAVQPRGLGAYAAFLAGVHTDGYGNNVLARRALCQRSIGGHWCGRLVAVTAVTRAARTSAVRTDTCCSAPAAVAYHWAVCIKRATVWASTLWRGWLDHRALSFSRSWAPRPRCWRL